MRWLIIQVVSGHSPTRQKALEQLTQQFPKKDRDEVLKFVEGEWMSEAPESVQEAPAPQNGRSKSLGRDKDKDKEPPAAPQNGQSKS